MHCAMSSRRLIAAAVFPMARLGTCQIKSKIISALAASALAGCSSVIEGTEQLKVVSTPGGADCALERQASRRSARVGTTLRYAAKSLVIRKRHTAPSRALLAQTPAIAPMAEAWRRPRTPLLGSTKGITKMICTMSLCTSPSFPPAV